MAELSDDTLSDDDPLKRNEELEEGHPFRGLVFHWASDIGGWGNKALGDDDQAWADEYKLSIREGAPEYLQDRVRLVPRVFEGPPPPTADAAFRAALVGDVFGYYPLAYKIRIASVVSKEALKYVRGAPVDLTKIRRYRASYARSPKRFKADAVLSLLEGGTWRVPKATKARHGIRPVNRSGRCVSTVVARVDRPRYLPHQPPKEHDR